MTFPNVHVVIYEIGLLAVATVGFVRIKWNYKASPLAQWLLGGNKYLLFQLLVLDYHLPPRTQPSPSPTLFWNILLAPWLVSQLLSQPLRMVPSPSPKVTLVTLLSAVYVAPPSKLCLISSPPRGALHSQALRWLPLHASAVTLGSLFHDDSSCLCFCLSHWMNAY